MSDLSDSDSDFDDDEDPDKVEVPGMDAIKYKRNCKFYKSS